MSQAAAGPRRLALAALVAVAVAALFPAPADAQRRFSCKNARGTTIAQTAEARVYFVSNGRNAPVDVFACYFGRRTPRVELGTSDVESSIDRPVLAGRFVAFARTDASPASGEVESSRVEVWDLRRGEQRFEHVEGAPSEDPNAVIPFVDTVVLTRSASVAWTSSNGAVRRSEGLAAPVTLGEGADPRSLALADREPRRLFWTRAADGAAQTATIR